VKIEEGELPSDSTTEIILTFRYFLFIIFRKITLLVSQDDYTYQRSCQPPICNWLVSSTM
jgi:hypothetical protein